MVVPCDGPSDFELIRQMAEQTVNFAGARNAWARFYVRHQRPLFLVCKRDYEYLLGEDGVEDLVHDTFMRAFDRAATFDHREVCDALVQERKCRRWLARIAENLLRDRLKGQREVSMVQLDDEDLEKLAGRPADGPTACEVPQDKRIALISSGFARLSETEQTVLWETMFWWQPGRNHQRMPHVAMEQLSRQVAKSPATIRQIRLRALEELTKYVNENLPHEKAD
jgi:RNA polymerase sigma factor (sigma-70 family)